MKLLEGEQPHVAYTVMVGDVAGEEVILCFDKEKKLLGYNLTMSRVKYAPGASRAADASTVGLLKVKMNNDKESTDQDLSGSVAGALASVEKLLTSSSVKPKKPTMKKAVGLKPAKARKPAKKVKAEVDPLMASAETWEKAHKILALYAPNLKKLKKLITKGLMSVDEVVAAVVEALKTKHVSMHLAGALAEVLKDVLTGEEAGDVYDMNSGDENQSPPPDEEAA